MPVQRKDRDDLSSYFELSEDDLVVDELQEMTFGEYLVQNSRLTRIQLFEALREQDKHPGIPLGEVIAYLGYLAYAEIDQLLTRWGAIPVKEVG